MSPASNQGSSGGISDEPRGIIETAIFKRKGDLLMQKKIIALAVAGLMSGAAFAQSNVTVYGIADGYYAHYSTDGLTANVSNSGGLAGSRLGFKGEEALGGGLKAIFTLEYGLNIDDNSGVGTTLARQQFVGLAGGFGQVTFGRQYAPGYAALVNNDPFMGSTPSPIASILQEGGGLGGNTINSTSAARWNNAIAYQSANFSGLTLKGIYDFGQTSEIKVDGVSERDSRYGLGANYANGPMNLDVVYQNIENSTAISSPNTAEWYFGASYNFGAVKVLGSYQTKNDKSTANKDNKAYDIGVQIPMGASTIAVSYARLNPEGADNSSSAWGAAYLYSLSKRTTLYATYTHVSNDNNANASPANLGVLKNGNSANLLATGINHSF
jgi:predicted porin